MATNGHQRILELTPDKLHQRTPIFIGSRNLVQKAIDIMNQYDANALSQ
jgi:fructose-1,6-bisphosphatase I